MWGKPPCLLSELSVIISEHCYQCGRQHRNLIQTAFSECKGMTPETTALPQPETVTAVTTVQQEGLTRWSIIIRLFFSFTKWSCSLWACWTMWLACFFSAEIFSWETEDMVERHSWDNLGFDKEENGLWNLSGTTHTLVDSGPPWPPKAKKHWLWLTKLNTSWLTASAGHRIWKIILKNPEFDRKSCFRPWVDLFLNMPVKKKQKNFSIKPEVAFSALHSSHQLYLSILPN